MTGRGQNECRLPLRRRRARRDAVVIPFNEAVALATKFSGNEPKRVGKELVTFCPGHEDPARSTPSLRIREGKNGSALIKCWSKGCSLDDILSGWGIDPAP